MRVDFYHLTRSPVEQTLPQIAEKVLAAGKRLLIVAGDAELRARIDSNLWTFRADSFIPHGLEGDQPVLIQGDAGHAGYPMQAYADGVWRGCGGEQERIFHFFDEHTIDVARTAWREIAALNDTERHYWKQTTQGGWQEGP